MTDKITIEIDGRPCEATPGEMIIAVADREGIDIPRFCYHKKLSIAANCRMCLVQAEQGGRPLPKPVPACATPVGRDMKVVTRSPLALEAQRGTMEFLLINHPLDCPICDQGGECELQDVAMGYGGDVSRYTEGKRVVEDEDLGPLIATDMTRCIHCTRCVRFCAEIAGVRELGATGRGEDMRIGTHVAATVEHELSGNIIDLCPVGALTSKPYRFTARSWELTQRDAIAPHDAVGSNLHLHIRGNRVMRVHPKENEAVNETWISDRDRFSYQGLASDERLHRPMVKQDGEWREVDWQAALERVAARFKDAGDGLGALMAPTATLEEMYLAQRLLRGLGSAHIDTRLRQEDFRADAQSPRLPPLPWLGVRFADLERQQALLLVGTDIRQEQPLLAHRIRKAAMAGAQVALVNPFGLDLPFPSTQLVAHPRTMLAHLAAIARAAGASLGTGAAGAERGGLPRGIADALRAAGAQDRGLVLLGPLAAAHPDYGLLQGLARAIAHTTGARLGYLPPAANSLGAYLAGALPHLGPGAMPVENPGLDTAAMLVQPRDAYLLWGIEPAYDLGNPVRGATALAAARFVAACTCYRSPSLEAIADVMLPIAAFAETSGTYVNAQLDWQSFGGSVAPPGEARPGWKLLRVLGNRLDLPGFEYESAAEVLAELARLCEGVRPEDRPHGAPPAGLDVDVAQDPGATDPASGDGLVRVGNLPIYAVDPLVRHAPALQRTPLAGAIGAYLNESEAARLGLAEGDLVDLSQDGGGARTRVAIDEAVPTGCVRVPAGVAGSETLGAQIGPLSLTKV